MIERFHGPVAGQDQGCEREALHQDLEVRLTATLEVACLVTVVLGDQSNHKAGKSQKIMERFVQQWCYQFFHPGRE